MSHRGVSINPAALIEEVRKRPGIYDYSTKPLDRLDKLELWKDVGRALFDDWETLKKSVAYDRVIQLQKKWRSLRDAYMRELRWRRSGTKTSKRVYIYFKKLRFLGGMDVLTEAMMEALNNEEYSSDDDAEEASSAQPRVDVESPEPPKKLKRPQKPKPRKVKPKREELSDEDDDHHDYQTEEIEMPAYVATDDSDSDKLFLMSFLPEMRKLQPNIKMWMRAQIASIMQEAVTCQYNNTQPGASGYEGSSVNDVKNALSSSD